MNEERIRKLKAILGDEGTSSDSKRDPLEGEFTHPHEHTLKGDSWINSKLRGGPLHTAGMLTKKAAKGLLNLPTDLLYSAYNIPKYIAGEPQDSGIADEDASVLEKFRRLPYLEKGLGSLLEKGVDYLTDDALNPNNPQEQKYATAAEIGGGLIGPGFLQKGAKAGTKHVPDIVKQIAKRIPGAETGGELLNKIYQPLTNTQKIGAGAGIGASHAVSETLGDDTPLKRALSLGAGFSAPSLTQKGLQKLGQKYTINKWNDLVDPEKMELFNKTDIKPELASILKDEHPSANTIRGASQSIYETIGAGDTLATHRKETLGKILKLLDLGELEGLDSTKAGEVIRNHLQKDKDAYIDKTLKLKEKAFGHAHDTGEYFKKPKVESVANLPDKEYKEVLHNFLKESSDPQKRQFFNATDKEKVTILDNYLKQEVENPYYTYEKINEKTGEPEAFQIKVNREGKLDKNVYNDMLIPENSLTLLRKSMKNIFRKSGRDENKIPAAATDLFSELEKNNGWIRFSDFQDYIQAINEKGSPKWRSAAGKDLSLFSEAIENSGANPTAIQDIKDYRKFNADYKGSVSKEQQREIDKKILNRDLTPEEQSRHAFDALVKDLKKDATLEKRFFKSVSQEDARTLWKELAGSLSFSATAESSGANIGKFVKEYTNLEVPQREFLERVYQKAIPNAPLSLDDITKLIRSSRSTLSLANTSGSSQGIYNKRLLFHEVPNAIESFGSAAVTGNPQKAAKAMKNITKLFWPSYIGKALTDNYLLNTDFQNWLLRGTEVSNPQQMRSWLRNYPKKVKGFPIEETKSLLSIFNANLKDTLEKQKSVED